ncbi:MAG: lycopene cyclase domain-containing protein [Chitinophagales bacterium]|nr:lycopene cyclase domain-containing protein [Chitinophagales bacterium]MDW8272658.1 lycopene cyclase domain-containing protein [Chitinophagales bacterium]
MNIEQFTYLAINLISVSVPLACSFEEKLHFWKKWKYYLPSLCFTAAFFLIWDYFKTKYGVWSFNPKYVVGIYLWGMPLEEYLFFLTIPYACTFIYETVAYFIKKNFIPAFSSTLLLLLAIVLMICSFMFLHKTYTWTVLFGSAIIMPFVPLILKGNKLQSFLLAYAISIIPMLLVNGILTALPVVMYNDSENLGLRLGSIPVEDFLYNFILLGMNILLYELFRAKSAVGSIQKELPVVQLF